MKSEDFIEWLVKNYLEYRDPLDIMEEWFSQLPFEFKWGVYLKYFDEKGIVIDIQPIMNYNNKVYTEVERWIPNIALLGIDGKPDLPEVLTRLQAQQEAVKKAFELISK